MEAPPTFHRDSLINRSRVEWDDHTGRYPILYNCNIYVGCQHECRYCYARIMTKRFLPNLSWPNVHVVEDAVALAQQDISQPPGRIMFCSMTDPYQPIERTTHLSRRVLEVLLDSRHYVLILTKSPLLIRDFDLLSGRSNVEVGFTITALKDIPSWETNAPGNTERIQALRQAHKQGLKTFLSVEPWIPYISDPIEIVKALKPDVDRFIFGSMQYMGASRKFYAEQLPMLLAYLKENSVKHQIKNELRRCMVWRVTSKPLSSTT